ncbi:hypothetical protein L6452_20305 [Arctium lappa]|uniref:Uncharacterized protein n=1 Tax=Arctium lappa TaxID=4217 RepID=A0ACB9BBU4_ARCLA|nr:hypothetical protein L6452_20305 [Arctium lappa]
MWDIVENGPSAEGKIGQDGRRPPPKTDAEKKVRQLEMKALSTLLLAIPNEYQHQFHHCTDAQILWNALEKRFAGTKSTKRNQRDILKQQYENFTSSKNESMTQTFDRFNKLIDEWTMYTVSFRQNDKLEEKELDDLYNDLRVFESEVEAKKKPTGFVHNAALLSASTDSTANAESVNAANGVNQEKGNESVFEVFLSILGNSSLINDDLEQIHLDDLEEMDIKWQMAMLSMRVKKFIKRTGRNNFSQRREDGAGFDKSKVECYKCHMKGHFARECRSGVSHNNHQQVETGSFNQNRNSAQALVSQQGMRFDWSDQAEEVIQNQALMAEVSDLLTEVLSNLCSQTCIDTVKRYRDHNQSMSDDLKRLEKDRKDYVKLVERFEEQIKGFQANELQHTYDTNYWKWEKNELEIQLTKSREENEKLRGELAKVKLDVEKFSYASKAMVSILKTEKEAGKSKDNTVSGEIPLENNILTNEGGGRDWVKSDDVEKTEGKSKKVHYKQTTVVNPVLCKQCAGNKSEPLKHDKRRGNQRNWNNQWAQKQGVDLSRIIRPKPCFIYGKMNHLAKHCYFNPINQRINFQRSVQKPFGYRKDERNHVAKKPVKSKSHMKKKTVKESVKMWVPKSTKIVSTATTNSVTDKDSAARSNTAAINVSAAESISTSKTNIVSTSSDVNTANSISTSKISTASSVCASRPIILTKATQQLKGKSIWHVDSGCSRHMTGNMACLKNFKKIDGGHVAFGNTPDGGKISGKGDVTKGKMTFEDVYYVEQLRTKDETSGLIKSFILRVENQTNQKVKVIRSDNGTEFKNLDLNTFCEEKGIERQYNAPRTPQQNGVAERRNRTLIEDARSLLADSKLPITFWAEAVNTACYVQNRVLVAYRVFNSSSRIIEENDNVKCNENSPHPIGSGPQWLFDIDLLTNSLGFSSDDHAGSGSRGSEDEQLQDIIPQSVIFPIPAMNPVEICETETVTEPIQSEEERRDEENPEHEEPEVADEIPSADLNDSNLDVGINEEASHQTRTQKNHPPELVIGDITSPMMTRNQSRVQDLQDQQHTILSCFLSQIEPKKAYDAMKDSSWIEAMQEELIQFKLQDVWDLVDLPKGYTQEQGIDYEEVFSLVARVEAIRLFLAYASYMKFKVYQMDVKSPFLYGTIDEEVYVCQPPGFENPLYPDRVYKLKKALYGLHQAPRACNKDTLLVQIYVDDIICGSTKDQMCRDFEELMHKSFKMSSMGELTFFLGLQVKQQKDGIFISQSKYVQDILDKYGLSDSKPASTSMETHKQITADLEGEDVDVHLYRSMIGSLMYLTASRSDIMFPVCVCARFHVKLKQSHLQAVKRIFRYLRGQPRLGLWYPYESTFDLIAYLDSDLGGANMDRKSTSGGCQLLGARLVSWQCKKQTTISLSTTEAEYIATTSCCSQVLWIHNQMLDYGVTFLHTPILIDNSSAISIVNNPVKHSKTKHIEIRYHFVRDCNEKKLIQVAKVHTDNQFADLFTKAFDVGRFTFLVTSVGMINSE